MSSETPPDFDHQSLAAALEDAKALPVTDRTRQPLINWLTRHLAAHDRRRDCAKTVARDMPAEAGESTEQLP